MTKQVLYKYLGTNGVIVSPVHLEDIYYVRMIRLMADSDKQLTKDGISYSQVVTVSEDEASEWYEVDR